MDHHSSYHVTLIWRERHSILSNGIEIMLSSFDFYPRMHRLLLKHSGWRVHMLMWVVTFWYFSHTFLHHHHNYSLTPLWWSWHFNLFSYHTFTFNIHQHHLSWDEVWFFPPQIICYTTWCMFSWKSLHHCVDVIYSCLTSRHDIILRFLLTAN